MRMKITTTNTTNTIGFGGHCHFGDDAARLGKLEQRGEGEERSQSTRRRRRRPQLSSSSSSSSLPVAIAMGLIISLLSSLAVAITTAATGGGPPCRLPVLLLATTAASFASIGPPPMAYAALAPSSSAKRGSTTLTTTTSTARRSIGHRWLKKTIVDAKAAKADRVMSKSAKVAKGIEVADGGGSSSSSYSSASLKTSRQDVLDALPAETAHVTYDKCKMPKASKAPSPPLPDAPTAPPPEPRTRRTRGGDAREGGRSDGSSTNERKRRRRRDQNEAQGVQSTTPLFDENTGEGIIDMADPPRLGGMESLKDDTTSPQLEGETSSTSTSMTMMEYPEEDYDDMCDEYGNLLSNYTSFAPTSAAIPIDVVDDASNATVVDDGGGGSGVDSDGDGLAEDDAEPDDVDDAHSPGCKTWSAYEVNRTTAAYATGVTAVVDFTYEIAIIDDENNANVNDIVASRMERLLALLIGRSLIGCGDGERMLMTGGKGIDVRIDAGGRKERPSGRRRMYVDGVDPLPLDSVVRDATCEYYTLDNPAPDGTTCHVARGMMTLYLREDDPSSSSWESSSEALKAIQTAMNMGMSSPFLEGSGDSEYSVVGVRAVRYVRGVPDDGMDVFDHGGSNSYGGSVEGDNVDGASAEIDAANASASSSSSLSTAGIVMISIGTIAMIGVLVGVVVTAKRRKMGGEDEEDKARWGMPSPSNSKATTYAEFYEDDDDLDIRQNVQQQDERRGFDDDESIFSGLSAGEDKTVMTNRDVNFVHDRDDAATVAMTVEQGYEVKFRPSSGYGADETMRDPTSYPPPTSRYKPRVLLEYPSYVNPSRIEKSVERNGHVKYVGDTVDF